MTVNPSPIAVRILGEQRASGFLAENDRDRLAQLTERDGGDRRRQRCSDFPAVVAIVVALALLFAAGTAVAQELPPQAQQVLVQAAALDTTQATAELPGTSAVQKVREASNE